ncbi:M48 metallopeptidase family protein [Motilimonas eburnea]|uniref:M48 metallopeptidase family protein n=1 Tax=Motilimonas eburnea TaxID=1737488 RepID=UPI001E3B4111|nr:M48 family metallopeptidase [Motilimonas eburnea]MCE2571991.1 M48 family metallopeptidase [Motilimonas eburnea]
MSAVLKYVQGYPLNIQQSVAELVASKKLGQYLRNKYPEPHQMTSEKSLYDYVMGLKKRYLKQSAPISKVVYDNKLHLVKHALGTHTYVSRVQGNKLKAKQEIRIAGLFKQAPEAMLNMIVVHELAHLKEKEHNKAFYQLCQYMQGDYHQLELDTRLFLTQLELAGPLYK